MAFSFRMVAATLLATMMLSSCLFSRLPAQMPRDFSLEVHRSGGMLPYSSNVTYGLAGCRFQKNYAAQGQPLMSDFRFTLPESLLRSLYAQLINAPFDLIGTHQEEIYDRGGFQVTVTAGGQTFTVVDGGQTVVDGFWLPSWKAIYQKLEELEAAALEQAGSVVTLRLSPDVRKLTQLYISLDFTSVLANPGDVPETVETRVFPGTYLLRLSGADYNRAQAVTVEGPAAFDVTLGGATLSAN